MESNYKTYNIEDSVKRINDILTIQDKNYEDLEYIPTSSKLTYDNGFYVKGSVLYVDIRNSTQLSQQLTHSGLARLYRVFISEMVALLNEEIDCKHLYIEGDCVWGIFDTPNKIDVDYLFTYACKINTLMEIINYIFGKKNIKQFKAGIGLDYGSALMIKAGYNGSGINEITWSGDVVGQASKLSHFGNKTFSDSPIMLTNVIYINLNEHNKKLCIWNSVRGCYEANAINNDLYDWYKQNCK